MLNRYKWTKKVRRYETVGRAFLNIYCLCFYLEIQRGVALQILKIVKTPNSRAFLPIRNAHQTWRRNRRESI